MLHGRRYNEGMHQAIEAKEGVEVQAENQTLATITLQNYFRLYEKLSGMTGTAQTEAAELHQIYKLGVVTIPTNRPMIRADQADLIYKTEEAKFDAVAADIAEKHRAGQPVLVGTTSVEKSEYLSKLLLRLQVPHEVLNAKQHEREAHIVAMAGHAGAVTVATNMAGRGTDIVLGGNPEFLADEELRRRGLDPVETREQYEAAWDGVLASIRQQVAAEAEEVKEAGGLYVLGTERHESRRIDNQLRGRSGRQGDQGESRFYLSLGDELMRRFNGQIVESIMNRFNLPDDVPIEAGMVTKAIRSAQTQVEQQNFEIRKNVLKYDEVLNKQRTVIYAERRRVLAGEDIKEQIEHMLVDVVTAYVDGATAEGYAEDWDLDKLWTALGTLYPVSVRWQDIAGDGDDPSDLSRDELAAVVLEDAQDAYARREAEIDALIAAQGGMRELERQVLLQVMDRKWREHLYEMDYLKEGIGLRAMAQRDPLIEYQREGFDMFSAMLEGIKEETVGHLFNVRVQTAAPEQAPADAAPAPAPQATRTGPPAPVPEAAGRQAGRARRAQRPARRPARGQARRPALHRPRRGRHAHPQPLGERRRGQGREPRRRHGRGQPARRATARARAVRGASTSSATARRRPRDPDPVRGNRRHGDDFRARRQPSRSTVQRHPDGASPIRSNRAASARIRPSTLHTAATSATRARGRHTRSDVSRLGVRAGAEPGRAAART